MHRHILPFPDRGREQDARTADEHHLPEEQLLGQFIPLHYHFNMLQDENRVTAFRQAIELTVREGMRVLELGGGTGIFSYFAARRGGQVICVERNPELVRLSRQFLADNLPPIASRSCRPMPLST
jgi:predicted O-methyltransferase YrrM